MYDFSGITIDLGTLIGVLVALAIVMVLIILYHILFIVVDVRKMVRRAEGVTAQVEAVILKPLAIADQAMSWVTDFLESFQDGRRKPHAHNAVGKHEAEDEDSD